MPLDPTPQRCRRCRVTGKTRQPLRVGSSRRFFGARRAPIERTEHVTERIMLLSILAQATLALVQDLFLGALRSVRCCPRKIEKRTANPGGRSVVMELATATLLNGHDCSNFRTAVGKLINMAPWRPDMQFAIQHLSTQVLNPTTESRPAVKQLIRYLKGTHKTGLRREPHIFKRT